VRTVARNLGVQYVAFVLTVRLLVEVPPGLRTIRAVRTIDCVVLPDPDEPATSAVCRPIVLNFPAVGTEQWSHSPQATSHCSGRFRPDPRNACAIASIVESVEQITRGARPLRSIPKKLKQRDRDRIGFD
jgi:hypothetical protein